MRKISLIIVWLLVSLTMFAQNGTVDEVRKYLNGTQKPFNERVFDVLHPETKPVEKKEYKSVSDYYIENNKPVEQQTESQEHWFDGFKEKEKIDKNINKFQYNVYDIQKQFNGNSVIYNNGKVVGEIRKVVKSYDVYEIDPTTGMLILKGTVVVND